MKPKFKIDTAKFVWSIRLKPKYKQHLFFLHPKRDEFKTEGHIEPMMIVKQNALHNDNVCAEYVYLHDKRLSEQNEHSHKIVVLSRIMKKIIQYWQKNRKLFKSIDSIDSMENKNRENLYDISIDVTWSLSGVRLISSDYSQM